MWNYYLAAQSFMVTHLVILLGNSVVISSTSGLMLKNGTFYVFYLLSKWKISDNEATIEFLSLLITSPGSAVHSVTLNKLKMQHCKSFWIFLSTVLENKLTGMITLQGRPFSMKQVTEILWNRNTSCVLSACLPVHEAVCWKQSAWQP